MSSKLAEGVNLDTNGVVVLTANGVRLGWMHPFQFRDMFPEHWEELLARPRVQSEYTEEELKDEEPTAELLVAEPRACPHTNLTDRVSGNGSLTTCDDCGAATRWSRKESK